VNLPVWVSLGRGAAIHGRESRQRPQPRLTVDSPKPVFGKTKSCNPPAASRLTPGSANAPQNLEVVSPDRDRGTEFSREDDQPRGRGSAGAARGQCQAREALRARGGTDLPLFPQDRLG